VNGLPFELSGGGKIYAPRSEMICYSRVTTLILRSVPLTPLEAKINGR